MSSHASARQASTRPASGRDASSRATARGRATRVVALAVIAGFFSTSCATLSSMRIEDPVVCGVVGTVVGGLAGGFLAAAARDGNAAGAAILGTTVGAGAGGWAGHALCKDRKQKARAAKSGDDEAGAAETDGDDEE